MSLIFLSLSLSLSFLFLQVYFCNFKNVYPVDRKSKYADVLNIQEMFCRYSVYAVNGSGLMNRSNE